MSEFDNKIKTSFLIKEKNQKYLLNKCLSFDSNLNFFVEVSRNIASLFKKQTKKPVKVDMFFKYIALISFDPRSRFLHF